MINNKHQKSQSVFSRQPHTSIVQILPTSGTVPTVRRTNGYHPARQTRVIPLNARGVSRDSARLPADPAGEWPDHPTHTVSRVTTNIRNRPDSAPAHPRSSQSNTAPGSHQRQAATLVNFDSTKNIAPRANTPGPGTGTHIHASRPAPGRGAPIDPDNSRNAFTHTQRPRGGVGQDKGVLTNASSASVQPAADTKSIRVQSANNAVVRSQNIAAARQKPGRITLWGLDPALKYELERIAAEEGMSLSHVGAIACEQWVHQRLHDRHEALLYPTMRQLVRDENHALGNRLVFFQMRTAFAAEQTRILTTNILSRTLKQQGVPDEIFNTLVDKSSKMAKRNIIARTPELKSLIKEWWAYLPDDIERPRQKGEQA